MSKQLGKTLVLVRQLIGWAVVIALIAVVLAIVYAAAYPTTVNSQVNVGMTRQTVVEVLGKEPGFEESILRFCRDGTWHEEDDICQRATASKSTRFMIWQVGIDTVLVVGIDVESRVVFHAVADT